jgi:hypothetical protein
VFTSTEVSFFVGTPLHAIDLRKYVEQKNRTARGEASVSAQSPLRVMLHPSSNSHIARTSVNRLEKDMSDFATDENAGSLPVLKATSGPVQDVASVEQVASAVSDIIAALEKLRDRDISTVQSGVKELLAYCNGETSGGNGHLKAFGYNLLQKARYESAMVGTFQFL